MHSLYCITPSPNPTPSFQLFYPCFYSSSFSRPSYPPQILSSSFFLLAPPHFPSFMHPFQSSPHIPLSGFPPPFIPPYLPTNFFIHPLYPPPFIPLYSSLFLLLSLYILSSFLLFPPSFTLLHSSLSIPPKPSFFIRLSNPFSHSSSFIHPS